MGNRPEHSADGIRRSVLRAAISGCLLLEIPRVCRLGNDIRCIHLDVYGADVCKGNTYEKGRIEHIQIPFLDWLDTDIPYRNGMGSVRKCIRDIYR